MKLYKNIGKITALLCACAMLLSFGGCSSLENLFGEASRQSRQSEISSVNAPNGEDIYTSYAFDSIDDDKTKNLYLEIANAMQGEVSDEVKSVGTLSEKQMMQAIISYKNDYPQTFWLGEKYSYYYSDGYTYLNLSFSVPADGLTAARESFNSALDDFTENAPVNSSEYERVLYANNYIADNCVYDSEAAEITDVVGNESDAYGALVGGKAVCSGYSRAFQLLCNKLGIECVNVTGMGNDSAHQWNCVKIDGGWYNADVTWNDSDEVGLSNDYLNLSDEQFYPNHTPDRLFSQISDEEFNDTDTVSLNTFVPECASVKYNYYRMTSPTLYELGGDCDSEISSALAEAIRNGDECFSVVVDDCLDFESVAYELIDEGYSLNYIRNANLKLWGQYSVTSEFAYPKENIRVITILLKYN